MAMMAQVLLIGFVAGIAGGMFGIGGGAIMVPALVLILGMSQKLSTGTSIIAQIFPIGLFAAVVYFRAGNVNIKQGILLAFGLILGNLFGALFANQTYVSDDFMKKLYGVFLFAIGARYLFWDAALRLFQKS